MIIHDGIYIYTLHLFFFVLYYSCFYIYIHICTHTHIHKHVDMDMQMLHICIYVCIMHTYVHIDIYLCIYIYMLRNRVWFLSSTCDLANICNYIFRDSNTYFDIHMQDIHTCCLYVCTYIYTGKSTQIYPIKLITVTLKIIF